jgi:transposase InsO family protein
VHAALRRKGHAINRKKVERTMRERDIQGVTRRKRRYPTKQDTKAAPAPDLAGHGFTAAEPGTKLVGDITYLATVIDLATREVIGYAMADHHRAELVTDALKMAAGRGRLQPGCITHSDRGSEYTSSEFRREIRKLNLRQSMGRTGICCDNAAATNRGVSRHAVTEGSAGSVPTQPRHEPVQPVQPLRRGRALRGFPGRD